MGAKITQMWTLSQNSKCDESSAKDSSHLKIETTPNLIEIMAWNSF